MVDLKSDYVPALSSQELQYSKFIEKQKELTGSQILTDNIFLSIDRRKLSKILARIELFKLGINLPGVIVECGVHKGEGLMLYYHLSSIIEPFNFNRKIIGFDTFEGFPSVHANDSQRFKPGHLNDASLSVLEKFIEIQDLNRPISHIPKVVLVKGDAIKTIPQYLNEHPETLISLLYLDFDLYEPTKIALEKLLPLVPKGGVVAFDELGSEKWKGETTAFKEILKIKDVELRKFIFDPHISYFVV